VLFVLFRFDEGGAFERERAPVIDCVDSDLSWEKTQMTVRFELRVVGGDNQ
jgi:hypothetical protein